MLSKLATAGKQQGGTMPIPTPTLEKSLAWVRRAESLLEVAVVEEKDPKEVFWCAADIAQLLAWSDFWEVRCRAGHALIKILESAAPGPNRNAIEQAVSGVEDYQYPPGMKPQRSPKGATGGATKRDRRGQQAPVTIN